MKLLLTLILLFFVITLKAQLFFGLNFNFFQKNELRYSKSDISYISYENTIGYKIMKKPYNIKMSFYLWDYNKVVDVPKQTTLFRNFTIPFSFSRRIYLNDAIKSIYFNAGLKYSVSYGKSDDLNVNGTYSYYFTHGPGYDLSVSGEFGIYLISIGIQENFEILGLSDVIEKRAIYFSLHLLLSKKELKRRYIDSGL